MSNFRGIEGTAEERERLVVGTERHRKWVAVLAAVREREPGRIVEARRRAVDHLSDQGERLERARTQLFDQEQRCEIAKLALVRERQHRTQAFLVDVGRPDLVPGWHRQLPHRRERPRRILAAHRQHGVLGRTGTPIDQVGDHTGMLTDDPRVWLGGEVVHLDRVPVIAARQPVRLVHPLLNDGPLAVGGDDEGVQVNLKAVGDGVVVDAGGESAGAHERVTVEADTVGNGAELRRCIAGVPAAAAAHIDAQLRGPRVQALLERPHHRGGDPGGMPVHAHHRAEGLEPEGIAQPG